MYGVIEEVVNWTYLGHQDDGGPLESKHDVVMYESVDKRGDDMVVEVSTLEDVGFHAAEVEGDHILEPKICLIHVVDLFFETGVGERGAGLKIKSSSSCL